MFRMRGRNSLIEDHRAKYLIFHWFWIGNSQWVIEENLTWISRASLIKMNFVSTFFVLHVRVDRYLFRFECFLNFVPYSFSCLWKSRSNEFSNLNLIEIRSIFSSQLASRWERPTMNLLRVNLSSRRKAKPNKANSSLRFFDRIIFSLRICENFLISVLDSFNSNDDRENRWTCRGNKKNSFASNSVNAGSKFDFHEVTILIAVFSPFVFL